MVLLGSCGSFCIVRPTPKKDHELLAYTDYLRRVHPPPLPFDALPKARASRPARSPGGMRGPKREREREGEAHRGNTIDAQVGRPPRALVNVHETHFHSCSFRSVFGARAKTGGVKNSSSLPLGEEGWRNPREAL